MIIPHKKQGFTLIELLVVIAIIGSLSAMLVPNFMAAREKSRDAVRKSDLSQIQKALELYKQDTNPPSFPAAMPTPGQQWIGPTPAANVYMQKFPKDPLSSGSTTYPYYYLKDSTDPMKYTLAACLENKGELDLQDCSTTLPKPFNSIAGYTCQSDKCYILHEP
jgi:general secretion pathway protein G